MSLYSISACTSNPTPTWRKFGRGSWTRLRSCTGLTDACPPSYVVPSVRNCIPSMSDDGPADTAGRGLEHGGQEIPPAIHHQPMGSYSFRAPATLQSYDGARHGSQLRTAVCDSGYVCLCSTVEACCSSSHGFWQESSAPKLIPSSSLKHQPIFLQ